MPEVILSHPWQDHAVGDRVDVDEATAKKLIRAGTGLYATKADAEAVGGDPEDAASTRKRSK